MQGALTIDVDEAPERRMERMIRESPVVVFTRRGCYTCDVILRLLAVVGAHATVIVLEDGEAGPAALPALFIGGAAVGGFEGLVALHLGGRLVPRLREAGA
ncbi:glutaredoxin subgroup III [Musa troglodytarum]|uniref:Glutaredoxin subgroup III n=1 Tax=Musa troglodytarum TaxID=320322 RepID=A0A9E7IJT6_9LILI|nr:glutaredoxin subgroup III [Musa troglodytarum]